MSADRIEETPQDGLFDTVIENDLLDKALEKRQGLKEKVAKANADLKKADEAARAMLPDLEVDQVARCGRFRIKTVRRSGGHTEFDTEPKIVTSIGLFDAG